MLETENIPVAQTQNSMQLLGVEEVTPQSVYEDKTSFVEDRYSNNQLLDTYFGGIETKAPKEVGFLYNALVGTSKAGLRGSISVPAGFVKSWHFLDAKLEQDSRRNTAENLFISEIGELRRKLDNKEISEEHFNKSLDAIKLRIDDFVKADAIVVKQEREKTKQALRNVDDFVFKLQDKLNLNRRRGEGGFVVDAIESAPNTLAAIGITALSTKVGMPHVGLALSAGFLFGSQFGSFAHDELEQGNTLGGAFSTTAITLTPSVAFDVFGAKYISDLYMKPAFDYATKVSLYNRLVDWGRGNPSSKVMSRLGVMARGAVAAGGEEFATGTIQSVLETNIPRWVGQGSAYEGFWKEIRGYLYEGSLEAFSGGLFGAAGNAYVYNKLRPKVYQVLRKNGAEKAEAEELANDVTSVLVAKHEELGKQLINELSESNKDGRAEEVANSIKAQYTLEDIIFGGLKGTADYPKSNLNDPKARLRERNLAVFESAGTNASEEEKVAAANMLVVGEKLEAEITGENIDKTASDLKVDVVEDSSTLNASDKLLNARAKEEGVAVGAVEKDLSSNIIYLLKNASRGALIHEVSHLLLKSVARAIKKVGLAKALQNPKVAEIFNLIGTSNITVNENGEAVFNDFTTEQQETFASAISDAWQNGSDSYETRALVNQAKETLGELYSSVKGNKELTDESKKAFASLFASEEAILPEFEVNEKNVKVLREAITQAKNGKLPSVQGAYMLMRLLQMTRGMAPIAIGQTLQEFIDNNPDYASKTPKEKRAMLAEAGFQDARNYVKYKTPEEYIREVESRPHNVFAGINKEAEAQNKKREKYNEYKALFYGILKEEKANISDLAKAIQKVMKQTGFTVVDKNFLNTVSNQLRDLRKVLKNYREQDVKGAVDNAKKIINFINKLAPALQFSGVNTSYLLEEVEKLQSLLKSEDKANLEKINKATDHLLSSFEYLYNNVVSKYIQSDFFLEQEGIKMPIINKPALTRDLVDFISERFLKGKSLKDSISLVKDLDKLLKDRGISPEVRKQITEKLYSKRGYLATAKNVERVVNDIINEVSIDFRKTMYEKINALWEEMSAEINNNDADYKRRQELKFIKENLIGYFKKHLSERDQRQIASGKVLEFDKDSNRGREIMNRWYALTELDFSGSVVGKDPVTGEDIFLSDEMLDFANQYIAYMKEMLLPYKFDVIDKNSTEAEKKLANVNYPKDEVYVEMYRKMMEIHKTTMELSDRLARAKEAQFKQAMVNALTSVSERKDMRKTAAFLHAHLFSDWLGGLQHNLLTIFGPQFVNIYGVLVEEKKVQQERNKIIKRLNNIVEKEYKGNAVDYEADLKTTTPFRDGKEGTLAGALKEYSKAQLLEMWLISKDEIGRKWIEKTVKGFKVADIVKAIEQHITKTDYKILSFMRMKLRDLYPDINKTFFLINGKPMGYRTDYWPLTTVKKDKFGGKEFQQTSLDVFIADKKQLDDPKYTNVRTGPDKDSKYVLHLDSPFKTFNKYISSGLEFVNLTPKLNMLSSILNSEDEMSVKLRNDIVEKFGEARLKALQNDLQYYISGRFKKRNSQAETFLQEVVSNFIIDAIAWKPWIAVKQFPAFLNYMEEVPSQAFAAYFLEFFSDVKKNYKKMMTFAPIFDRVHGEHIARAFFDEPSMIVDSLLGNRFVSEKLEKHLPKGWAKNIVGGATAIKKHATDNVRFGDAAAVIVGGYCYMRYRQDILNNDSTYSSLSNKEKREILEQDLISITETTQQSSLMSTRGSLQRSEGGISGVIKMSLMALSGANTQFLRRMAEAEQKYVNADKSTPKKEKEALQQFIKSLTIYGIIQPFCYNILSTPAVFFSLLLGVLGGQDDEKWKKNFYLALIRPYVDNFFAAWGSLGSLVTSTSDILARGVLKQSVYDADYDISPFFLQNLSRSLKSTFSEKDKSFGDMVVNASAFAPVFGVPSTFAAKAFKGTIEGLAEGEIYKLASLVGISENQVKKLLEEIE